MARPRKPRSPLDERGRQLAEEEHKLQAQMAALQRELDEAPRRQAEEARQRRESFLERSRRDVPPPARSPRRSGGNAPGRRYTPMLKRERRAAKLKAMALFVLLLVVIVWLSSNYLF